VKVSDWNHDLSPWKAPAVFGREDFGGGAAGTLEKVLEICRDPGRTYIIGGYSLAGLFALWAAYQTDVFAAAACASPSVWFPGFADYMEQRRIQVDSVYLSLGDKEAKSRNPVLASVEQCITEEYQILQEIPAISSTLEWNQGNHFKEPELRTAKAFRWCLKRI
jgi:predicted alpha/beta superfamily hydrolase